MHGDASGGNGSLCGSDVELVRDFDAEVIRHVILEQAQRRVCHIEAIDGAVCVSNRDPRCTHVVVPRTRAKVLMVMTFFSVPTSRERVFAFRLTRMYSPLDTGVPEMLERCTLVLTICGRVYRSDVMLTVFDTE